MSALLQAATRLTTPFLPDDYLTLVNPLWSTRELRGRVEAVLQAGVDSGEFRDIDARLTALAWLGMHNYTYLWLKADGRLTAKDVAKPFADIFIRGIGG